MAFLVSWPFLSVLAVEIFNYSPKAKLMLPSNPREKDEGII